MAQFFLQIGSCPVSSAMVMEEERYAEALDTLVVACVDIAVLHKKSILLGRRSRHPYPDWWILGGRMFRGEFFEDSARRILRREGNLVIEDKARFRRIGLANFLWKERDQLPAEKFHKSNPTTNIQSSGGYPQRTSKRVSFIGI